MGLMTRVAAAAALIGAALVAAPGTAAAAPTAGWNDWSCRPSAAHPEPVVLAHAMLANPSVNYAVLGPQLVSAGYCVFSTTYGATVLGDFVPGLDNLEESAATFAAFVDEVRARTGVAKVDVVGQSEGTTVPAYYLKFLGGAAKVDQFVGFSSNFRGTTMYGLNRLIGSSPSTVTALKTGGCGACADFMNGSDFMKKLNDGGITVPGPRYTSIISRLDGVVVPYTSGRLDGPGAKTIVLQDRCPLDLPGHVSQAFDPNVMALVLHELDPSRRLPACVPFFLGGM